LFGKKTVITTRFWAVFVASAVSMLSAYILTLTDNVVSGQFVGDDAVAAMTLILAVTTMILFMAYLISDGLCMMASYAQGRNDRAEVDRLFSLGIILSVGSGIIFLVLLYILREELLNFWENNYDIFRCRLVFHPVTNDICQRFDGKILSVKIEKNF